MLNRGRTATGPCPQRHRVGGWEKRKEAPWMHLWCPRPLSVTLSITLRQKAAPAACAEKRMKKLWKASSTTSGATISISSRAVSAAAPLLQCTANPVSSSVCTIRSYCENTKDLLAGCWSGTNRCSCAIRTTELFRPDYKTLEGLLVKLTNGRFVRPARKTDRSRVASVFTVGNSPQRLSPLRVGVRLESLSVLRQYVPDVSPSPSKNRKARGGYQRDHGFGASEG